MTPPGVGRGNCCCTCCHGTLPTSRLRLRQVTLSPSHISMSPPCQNPHVCLVCHSFLCKSLGPYLWNKHAVSACFWAMKRILFLVWSLISSLIVSPHAGATLSMRSLVKEEPDWRMGGSPGDRGIMGGPFRLRRGSRFTWRKECQSIMERWAARYRHHRCTTPIGFISLLIVQLFHTLRTGHWNSVGGLAEDWCRCRCCRSWLNPIGKTDFGVGLKERHSTT